MCYDSVLARQIATSWSPATNIAISLPITLMPLKGHPWTNVVEDTIPIVVYWQGFLKREI
jgi:hypothetical protein